MNIINLIHEGSSIRAEILEKDYYVTLLLRELAGKLVTTSEFDVCYLRSRLGYNTGKENYCFNGFAFRDQLMKNLYTRQL